jgi:hypothetical protein
VDGGDLIDRSGVVRALRMVRALVTGGILAVGLGVPIASPATAAPLASTYATAAYTYHMPALFSSPNAAVPYVRGSPSGPEVASWGRSASTHGRCTAANTARSLPTPAEAAELLRASRPTGSALKRDANYLSGSWVIDDVAQNGSVFDLVGGYGVSRTLLRPGFDGGFRRTEG